MFEVSAGRQELRLFLPPDVPLQCWCSLLCRVTCLHSCALLQAAFFCWYAALLLTLLGRSGRANSKTVNLLPTNRHGQTACSLEAFAGQAWESAPGVQLHTALRLFATDTCSSSSSTPPPPPALRFQSRGATFAREANRGRIPMRGPSEAKAAGAARIDGLRFQVLFS